jgi:hypothetical protein
MVMLLTEHTKPILSNRLFVIIRVNALARDGLSRYIYINYMTDHVIQLCIPETYVVDIIIRSFSAMVKYSIREILI